MLASAAMKNRIISFLLLVFTVVHLKLSAQTVDASPLDAYWQMIEPLKRGERLSKETWQQFIKIDANATYIKNQGFDSSYLERLRKAIEMVYLPEYDSLFKARYQKPLDYWLLYKVGNYKVYEKELKAYQQMVQQPGYFDDAYKYVWEWLPKSLQRRDTATRVYLLGIENDAIAGGHIMILTLWTAYNQEKIKRGILTAHEFHHILRTPADYGTIRDQDKGLMYVLERVLNEGSADMIDKGIGLANKDKVPFELYYEDFLLGKVDSIMKVLNTDLEQMAVTAGTQFKTERQFRELLKWSSGHCPGYYMANIIVRNGYKKQLVADVQNPFIFFRLYNKAAKKDKQRPPVFSDLAMKSVLELEQRYWVKKGK
jgi:hypothetical protein